MIDPFKETMLPLGKAARKVPGRKVPGRKVSTQTIYRWCSSGIDGIKLETIVIGGRMQTSQEALIRFFAAVTKAKQTQHLDDGAGERSEHVQSMLEAAGLV